MLCLKCNEREVQHGFWLEDGGVCDYCAEEFGCECGCFPPPALAEFAWRHDLDCERVEEARIVTDRIVTPQRIVFETDEDLCSPWENPQITGAHIEAETVEFAWRVETREVWKLSNE